MTSPLLRKGKLTRPLPLRMRGGGVLHFPQTQRSSLKINKNRKWETTEPAPSGKWGIGVNGYQRPRFQVPRPFSLGQTTALARILTLYAPFVFPPPPRVSQSSGSKGAITRPAGPCVSHCRNNPGHVSKRGEIMGDFSLFIYLFSALVFRGHNGVRCNRYAFFF